jgi:hypothetical protein
VLFEITTANEHASSQSLPYCISRVAAGNQIIWAALIPMLLCAVRVDQLPFPCRRIGAHIHNSADSCSQHTELHCAQRNTPPLPTKSSQEHALTFAHSGSVVNDKGSDIFVISHFGISLCLCW